MTSEERRILSPLASSLRTEDPGSWSDLKYETQNGPYFGQFPYHPAALEFKDAAHHAIDQLPDGDKVALLAAWRSTSRYPYNFTDDHQILRQYEVILVDLIVKRARQAGARTIEF